MIAGFIRGQTLRLSVPLIAADTINYLTAKFLFQSSDWDGLEKWAHFAKGGVAYDIRLEDDQITADAHLNLSAGKWSVYSHGNRYENGEVTQRVTTETQVLEVSPTGILDGEPFPTVPPSAGEQIVAAAVAAESGAKSAADEAGRAAGSAKDSADLAAKSAAEAKKSAEATEKLAKEAEQTVKDTLREAKESGEFDGEDGITPHIGANGNWYIGETDTGIPAQGKKGDPGDDYVLTAADKQEIAGMIPGGGDGSGGLVVLITENVDGTLSTTHTSQEILAAAETKIVTAIVGVVIFGGPLILPLVAVRDGTAMFEVTFVGSDNVGTVIAEVSGSDVRVHFGGFGEVGGATATDDGKVGLVPAPSAGQQDYVLHGDGTWRKNEAAGTSGSIGNVVLLVTGGSLENLFVASVIPPPGVSGEAAYELIARGLFDVIVQTRDADDNITGMGFLRGLPGDTAVAVGEFWTQGSVSQIQVGIDFVNRTVSAEVFNTVSGGGVVRITTDDDGETFSCSHTVEEIAAMAKTGAVVAAMLEDGAVAIMPLYGVVGEIAVFAMSMTEGANSGTLWWGVTPDGVIKQENYYRVAPMIGASAYNDGEPGTVPAPSAGQQDHVLHGDGTWRKIQVSGSGGGVNFTPGNALELTSDGVLNVRTASGIDSDNTLPVTSAAVAATVGNIEILLSTI